VRARERGEFASKREKEAEREIVSERGARESARSTQGHEASSREREASSREKERRKEQNAGGLQERERARTARRSRRRVRERKKERAERMGSRSVALSLICFYIQHTQQQAGAVRRVCVHMRRQRQGTHRRGGGSVP
jgi:hypothetical protein